MKKNELAKILNISHSAIVQWEQKGKIPDTRLFEIAPLLNVTPEALRLDPNLLFSTFRRPLIQKRPEM